MKITNYNPSKASRVATLMEAFLGRDAFPNSTYEYVWGDVNRTGDTVRFKEDDALTVELDLPGVSKDKTQVTVEGRIVYIEATRKVIHKGGVHDETITRSFSVGDTYSTEKVKAEQKDGVLTLVFARNKVDTGGRRVIGIS